MKKLNKYMHVQGMTLANAKRLRGIKGPKRPNYWKTLRVVKNPPASHAVVRALKGLARRKYGYFLVTFRKNP